MAQTTNISWTDATWNIARGCTKVDEDCKFCYMYRDSFDSTRYNPLEIVRTKTVFNLPLKLKEPSKIFTCSLTDFFTKRLTATVMRRGT
jgi:protein gp37